MHLMQVSNRSTAGYSFTDERITPDLWQSVWRGVPFSSAAVQAKLADYYGTPEALGTVRNILEIGCGSGVISLLLAQQFPEATIHSVDIDTGAVSQSLLNIEALEQEQWRRRMRVYHTPIQAFDPSVSRPCRLSLKNETAPAADTERGSSTKSECDNAVGETASREDSEDAVDVEERLEEKEVKMEEAEDNNAKAKETPPPPAFEHISEEEFNALEKCTSFDLILCSPPYFPTDHKKDRFVAAMDTQRRLARHTHTLTMAELVGGKITPMRLFLDVLTSTCSCRAVFDTSHRLLQCDLLCHRASKRAARDLDG